MPRAWITVDGTAYPVDYPEGMPAGELRDKKRRVATEARQLRTGRASEQMPGNAARVPFADRNAPPEIDPTVLGSPAYSVNLGARALSPGEVQAVAGRRLRSDIGAGRPDPRLEFGGPVTPSQQAAHTFSPYDPASVFGESFARAAGPAGIGLGVGAATAPILGLGSVPAGLLAGYAAGRGQDVLAPPTRQFTEGAALHPLEALIGTAAGGAAGQRPGLPRSLPGALFSGGTAGAGEALRSGEPVQSALAALAGAATPGGAWTPRRSLLDAPLPTPGRPLPAPSRGAVTLYGGLPVDPDLFNTPQKRLALGDEIAGLLNAPRSLRSSLDLSAPLRQGLVASLDSPVLAARAAGQMVRSLSPRQHAQLVDRIARDPDAGLFQRVGGYLSTQIDRNAPLAQREEAFMSRIAGGLPHVRRSENAYTAFLDDLRLSKFKQFKQQLAAAGITPQKAPREFEREVSSYAKSLNVMTGRGSLGKFDDLVPALNSVLFSTRFQASRVQFLTSPYTWRKMPPQARKAQMRAYVKYLGFVTGTLAAAKAAGAEVETDIDSPDWGKIKVPGPNGQATRYDLTAGMGAWARFGYRALRDLWRQDVLGEDVKRSPGQQLGDLAKYRLSPTAGYVFEAWMGKKRIPEATTSQTGAAALGLSRQPTERDRKRFQPGWQAADQVVPMIVSDFVEAARAEGLAGVAKTLPAFVGVGVNTYDQRPARGSRSRNGRSSSPAGAFDWDAFDKSMGGFDWSAIDQATPGL